MRLVEEGTLSLDDPLHKYIPEFANIRVLSTIDGDDASTTPVQRPPTLHDLLTHRSGLTYGWFGPEKLDAIYRQNDIPDLFVPIAETLEDRVRRIAKVPLKFQPGTSWDYSVATDVLGRVVEIASGKTLDEFFRDRFFVPLKMPDTHFYLPAEKSPRLATLYTLGDRQQLQAVSDRPITVGFLKFSSRFLSGRKPILLGRRRTRLNHDRLPAIPTDASECGVSWMVSECSNRSRSR